MKSKSLILVILLMPFVFNASASDIPGPESRSVAPPIASWFTVMSAYGGAVTFAGDDVIITENDGYSTAGMVHVIRRTETGRWEEVQVLHARAPFPGDGFGRAVAADENTLFVARYSRGENSGSVYIFGRDNNGRWNQSQIIEIEGASSEDRFGASIILMGNHAIIAAPGSDGGKGLIHTFMKSGDSWSHLGQLQPNDLGENAEFGVVISFANGLLAVAAPENEEGKGSVFLYQTANGGHSWTESGTISPPAGDDVRQFGNVLLTDGDRIYVGQPFADQLSGNVRVFSRDDTDHWIEVALLKPNGQQDAEQDTKQNRFGTALALSGDRLWVSAPGAFEDTGGIHIYTRGDEGFDRLETIKYAEAQQPRSRRSVLAVRENVAIIGVRGRDYGEGVAQILEREGDSWVQVRELYRDLGAYDRVTGGQIDCDNGEAAGWECNNVDLIAFIPNTELGAARGSRFNDVWGWTDPETGKEYGILGHMEAAIFIDLSDPENPIVLGELPRTKGSPGSTHRDIKVYKNHAFIVADGAEQHGMQIFDLTLLRNVPDAPVVFEPTAMYTKIASTHNIVINENTGYAYTVGGGSGGETCGGALHMINIQDPLNPTFAGCFQDTRTGRGGSGATHDAQCVTYNGPDTDHIGKEICIGYNGTAVSIADVSDKDNPVPISIGTYPNSAYVHQGWLTDDHRFFYQNDEADELRGVVEKTRTMIWDVTDLDDPIMIAEFYGKENSTDHNLYVKGDYMYQTNNASGLRIIDIRDREHPVEVGFFDTTPKNRNVAGFDGTWSSYPYFESGMILLSSRREGMFIVKKREVDI